MFLRTAQGLVVRLQVSKFLANSFCEQVLIVPSRSLSTSRSPRSISVLKTLHAHDRVNQIDIPFDTKVEECFHEHPEFLARLPLDEFQKARDAVARLATPVGVCMVNLLDMQAKFQFPCTRIYYSPLLGVASGFVLAAWSYPKFKHVMIELACSLELKDQLLHILVRCMELKYPLRVFCVPEEFNDVLTRYYENKTGKFGAEIRPMLDNKFSIYVGPSEEHLAQQRRPPAELKIQRLKKVDTDMIYDLWEYKREFSPFMISELTTRGLGVGAFLKDTEELVAWDVHYRAGIQGNLMTVPQHRRKGYGSLMVTECARDGYREGIVPACAVNHKNTISMELHRNIGWEVVGTCSVPLLLPRKMSP